MRDVRQAFEFSEQIGSVERTFEHSQQLPNAAEIELGSPQQRFDVAQVVDASANSFDAMRSSGLNTGTRVPPMSST